LTNTVSGIRPVDLPGFIVTQLFGAACRVAVATWLLRGVTTLLPPLPPRRRRFPRSVPWLKGRSLRANAEVV
jgi:hypothetical protein